MILIVEDNKDVSDLLKETLEQSGYDARTVYSGYDAMKQLRASTYELVLLDLMLPFKSGDQILKELRTFSNTPVIVLSAKDMVSTKIDLLKLGADDYVTKPFDLDEVMARVEATLRRNKVSSLQGCVYTHKELQLNTDTKQCLLKGKEISLTAKEYAILALMLSRKEKVFTKANLYETVWQEEYYGDDHTIKTHISNLRSKLGEEEYIETIRGLGYRICK